ncbi:MAG TPA: type II secretion system F family protein [Patescibacteria group bacterium]|nr:type II secretion system F family protein [Patescibacteria group bacterium]
MNYDEFAFFNQQLAAMLRQGIPLEGALKQLCQGMRHRRLQTEIKKLGDDLAAGTPLKDALNQRALPEFYRKMVEIGVASNDLPGMLTMLADHYHQANSAWTRLKGLMVYPLIVIIVSLGLTLILSLVFGRFLSTFTGLFQLPDAWIAAMWIPPLVLALLAIIGVAAISLPKLREKLRWRLPAFREASLAQLSSAIALMLRNGATLPDALSLAESLEARSPAGEALARWRRLVEAGQGRPTQWTGPCRPFPPLFLWLVQRAGEDPAAGFQKAAEMYGARAAHQIELVLYGALPISILFLGQMIFWQVAPMMQAMGQMMRVLGDSGG